MQEVCYLFKVLNWDVSTLGTERMETMEIIPDRPESFIAVSAAQSAVPAYTVSRVQRPKWSQSLQNTHFPRCL